MRIELHVTGTPITQGSKTAFRTKGGHTVVTESRGSKLSAWRSDIAAAARQAFDSRSELPTLLDEPVLIRAHFSLLRPKSHPKTKTTWPTGAQSGDIDKLTRAVLDALTGTLIRDDSRVVGVGVTKAWGDPPGVHISVETRDGDVHGIDYGASVYWHRASLDASAQRSGPPVGGLVDFPIATEVGA